MIRNQRYWIKAFGIGLFLSLVTACGPASMESTYKPTNSPDPDTGAFIKPGENSQVLLNEDGDALEVTRLGLPAEVKNRTVVDPTANQNFSVKAPLKEIKVVEGFNSFEKIIYDEEKNLISLVAVLTKSDEKNKKVSSEKIKIEGNFKNITQAGTGKVVKSAELFEKNKKPSRIGGKVVCSNAQDCNSALITIYAQYSVSREELSNAKENCFLHKSLGPVCRIKVQFTTEIKKKKVSPPASKVNAPVKKDSAPKVESASLEKKEETLPPEYSEDDFQEPINDGSNSTGIRNIPDPNAGLVVTKDIDEKTFDNLDVFEKNPDANAAYVQSEIASVSSYMLDKIFKFSKVPGFASGMAERGKLFDCTNKKDAKSDACIQWNGLDPLNRPSDLWLVKLKDDVHGCFVTEKGGGTKDYYGSGFLLNLIHHTCHKTKQFYPEWKIEINSISKAGGGPLPPHESHQNGLDIDVDYENEKWITKKIKFKNKDGEEKIKNKSYSVFNKMTDAQWDFWMNWLDSGYLNRIIVYKSVKTAVCDWAKTNYKTDQKSLDLLKHLEPDSGHLDHFHLAMNCPPAEAVESGCKQRTKIKAEGYPCK